MFVLWVMGCIYNIPPVPQQGPPLRRRPLGGCEQPAALLAGWFIAGTASVAPASLLLSYWMVGCYFMAMKRYRRVPRHRRPSASGRLRKSFAHYTEERLLVSIMFYGSSAMLFLGAFIMRYRLELILSFPLSRS